MKGWIAALCAAVVLTVCFGLPFRVHDTARLLPLKTVQVDLDGEGVLLRSEQGARRCWTWANMRRVRFSLTPRSSLWSATGP